MIEVLVDQGLWEYHFEMDIKQLEKSIEENDPNLKTIHQQNEIDQKKVELSRAMSLPKLEGGYRMQKILGQTFKGIYAGITIPLWESKNSVKLLS